MAGKAVELDVNEVRLVGRLSGVPEQRTLPSGHDVASWRLVLRRPHPVPGASALDTIDCSAFAERVRRASLAWEDGDILEVSGSLRRRFWRGPTGAVSRVDVLVERGRRVSRPPAGTS